MSKGILKEVINEVFMDIQIKGKAIIEIIEEATGEVVDRREQENLIINATYSVLVNVAGTSNITPDNIFISTSTATPVRAGITLFAIAIGTAVSAPTFNTVPTYPIYQVIQQFASTGTTRTFSTVGLTATGSNNNYNANLTTSNYRTYLLLDDAPCTQGPTQITQITYQVQFIYDTVTVPKWKAIHYGGALCCNISGYSNITMQAVSGYFGSNQYANEYIYLTLNAGDSFSTLGNTGNFFGQSGVAALNSSGISNSNATGFWTTYINSIVYNNNARDGQILNLLQYGSLILNPSDGQYYTWETGRYNEYTPEPFQTGFLHNTDSPANPFYVLASEGVGTGTMTLSGTWTNVMPFMLRIHLVAGGAVGTATYRYSVKYHVGFQAGNWIGRFIYVPWLNGNRQPHPNLYGWSSGVRMTPKLFSKQTLEVVYYAATGVSLLSLYSGRCRKWDTAEGMNATAIGQVTVAGAVGAEKIFVGCRNTGVWEIDPYANTVVQRVSGVGCYGICTGYNHEVFALCEGSLRSSANWATGLSITFTGLTNSNWVLCKYLKGDIYNSANQIAIIIETSATNHRIVWWNKTTAVAVGGPSTTGNSLLDEMSVLVTSTSRWVYISSSAAWHINHGAASGVTSSRNPGMQNLAANVIVPGGNDYYYVTNIGYIDPNTNSIYQADANISGILITANSGTIRCFLQLEPGVYLIQQIIGGGAQFKGLSYVFQACKNPSSSLSATIGWVHYGWNGTSWVEGSTTARTTHTAPSVLHQGISLAFANAATNITASFLTGEFMHRNICNGIMKTNATDIAISHHFYAKVLKTENYTSTIPGTAPYTRTLPGATDPLFIVINSADSVSHTMKVNSIKCPNIYYAGQAPGVNEVTINTTTGVCTFNAANAGHPFDAIPYTWISH